MTFRTAALAAALALAAPAAAQAHVTIAPDTAPPGEDAVLAVRVPNERSDANTTKVAVQLPDGFVSVNFEAVPGWKATTRKQKLTTPIKVEGIDIDEEVREVVFTADKGGGIAPGAFQDFPMAVLMPKGPAGTKLTFKALQTYSNGTVVRWIGPPSADDPAPQVTLASGTAPAAATGQSSEQVVTVKKETSNGLALVALIVGALGLATGVAGLAKARKTR